MEAIEALVVVPEAPVVVPEVPVAREGHHRGHLGLQVAEVAEEEINPEIKNNLL